MQEKIAGWVLLHISDFKETLDVLLGLSINQKVNVPLIRLSLKGMGNEERRLLEEI